MEISEAVKAFFMAVVQGIGEFLPISSSGHLLLIDRLFSVGGSGESLDGLTLSILLHVGTLFSILLVFRRTIFEMFTIRRGLFGLLAVGSIPTAVIGLGLDKKAPYLITSPIVAGFGFLVTAVLLLKYLRTGTGAASAGKTLGELSWFDAFWIGVVQGLAVLPGCSRSGFTIAAGRMRRLTPEDAAAFSFLLAIPAIGGAALIEGIDLFLRPGALSDPRLSLALAASAVSFAVGVAALLFLMRLLRSDRLWLFVWWLIPLGLATLLAGVFGYF